MTLQENRFSSGVGPASWDGWGPKGWATVGAGAGEGVGVMQAALELWLVCSPSPH